MLRLAPIALCLSLLAAPPALAEEGELLISADLAHMTGVTPVDEETSIIRQHTQLGASAHYFLTDFWVLGLSVRGGLAYGDAPDPEGLFQTFAEAQFILDALTWVPWACGGVGMLLRSEGPGAYLGVEEGPALDATVHFGVGVDYRPAREWSIGAGLRWHIVLTDDTSDPTALDGPFEIGFRFTWYLDTD